MYGRGDFLTGRNLGEGSLQFRQRQVDRIVLDTLSLALNSLQEDIDFTQVAVMCISIGLGRHDASYPGGLLPAPQLNNNRPGPNPFGNLVGIGLECLNLGIG